MSPEGRTVAVIERAAISRRHSLRTGLGAALAVLLAACAAPAVVEDHLESDGVAATEFSADDREIVLSARFDSGLSAADTFMVEWLFPDGSVYLRKPVRRSTDSAYRVDTGIPVRGKAPGRSPGVWHVQLSRDGRPLVSRAFDIRAGGGAPEFASLAYCGPSRWSDPVISAQPSAGAVPARPGTWIGGEVLEAAGATYSGAVLLTGCAPG